MLLELGRLVWEAITLEQDVYAICHLIDPRGVSTWGAEHASTRIRQARPALVELDDAALREVADRWLGKADEVLAHRNSILHAVPLTLSYSPRAGGTEQEWLAHFPRKPSGSSKMRPLTEESLRQLRASLQAVRAAGTEVGQELVEKLWRGGATTDDP